MRFILSVSLLFSLNVALAGETVIKRLAALDIGSGKTRIEVADVAKDDGKLSIKKSYYEASVDLKLSEDFKFNHNKFSRNIQTEAFEVLRKLKHQAEKFGPIDEYKGVATAVFREALQLDSKNTELFLEKIRRELKISIEIIPQEAEGDLGFKTGIAKSGLKADQVAAIWDSGNRSFQISDEHNIYQGQLGASLVFYLMIEEVQKKSLAQSSSPNPISMDQVTKLIRTIATKIPPAPAWLTEKISTAKNNKVLGLGGSDSLFGLGKLATESFSLKLDKIWKTIQELAPLTDAELKAKGYSQPDRAVTQLVFLYAVMQHLGIPDVTFVPILGNTQGVFLSPQYWQVWKNK
ncbi:MAG: hypothetical protein ABIQ95_09510 [Bdellovibrionia bacterium]